MSKANPTTLRGVIYARCSTLSQEESVADQTAWGQRVARVEGIDVVRVFADEGIPGDARNRPGLNDLLAFVDVEFYGKRQLDVLIVWDLDRLSRTSSLWTSAILSQLAQAGVTRVLTKDGWIDLSSAIDMLLVNVRSDFQSSGYVKSLSGNVLRTMLKKAKEGKRTGGRVPLGYAYQRDGTLALGAEADVETVRWIFQRYATTDTSTTDIARQLHARGVKPPWRAQEWRSNSVRVILTNRAYIGEFKWFARKTGKYHAHEAGEVKAVADLQSREQHQRRNDLKRLPSTVGDRLTVENAHPALIDAATFETVQQRLARNRLRRCAGTLKRRPLFGMFVCGACGGAAWCVPSEQHKKRQHNVICAHHKTQGPGACPGGGRADYVEVVKRVVGLLVDELGNPQARDTLRQRIEKVVSRRKADLARERESAARDAGRLEKESAQATRRLLLIPEHQLAAASEALDRITADLDAARARLAAVKEQERQSLTIDQAKADKLLALVARLPEMLPLADESRLRDTLRSLVERVAVHVKRLGDHHPTRGRPVFELVGVDVTLTPLFASLIGKGSLTTNSHVDQPVHATITLSWRARKR